MGVSRDCPNFSE